MIKPLWCVYYEYIKYVEGATFYNEIHVPAFDIGEALQNGTRAIVALDFTKSAILRIEKTAMRVALEAE